jgi:ribosomal protein S18 acetylase RimI-like enzyme
LSLPVLDAALVSAPPTAKGDVLAEYLHQELADRGEGFLPTSSGDRADSLTKAVYSRSASVSFARTSRDVDAVKSIADAYRAELGFHTRQSFLESLARRELLVARAEGRIVGFLRFHHTRAGHTTLQEIATCAAVRRRGVGRRLVGELINECRGRGSHVIRLSCPVELPANQFYASLGFRRSHRRSKAGKSRPLYQWELPLLNTARPLGFVASLTNAANDLRNLIPLWEKEGPTQRPFEHCIVTPLFVEPRTLSYVLHMREKWGVHIWFDSGGFFVQQGKIRYEDLFARLLAFYREHDWAAAYVLPDYVPTSKNSPAEVEERVRVTAAEGAKFQNRLPEAIRCRTLGVLQGHDPQHLRLCLESYTAAGVRRLGFGSFDTGGGNGEINLLTREAMLRLDAVRELLGKANKAESFGVGMDLHLFGVGSPNLLSRFVGFGASSFDSSGWMRTAGYGNVYLPFQGRRNVTHGASAVTCGPGLSAREFYALCEQTGHNCPFCADYRRLQTDRYARMWHNALVFGEMTRDINARRLGPLEHRGEDG